MTDNKSIKIFSGVYLIDGNGGEPVPDAMVVVEGDTITYAGRKDPEFRPEDAEITDATGLTLMPGLIDSHIHLQGLRTNDPKELMVISPEVRLLRSASDLLRLLDQGYTSVRDCGDLNAIHLKASVEEGAIPGPRIFACGTMICQTAGHGDPFHSLPEDWVRERGLVEIADGIDQCRRAARKQLRKGADFIKLCTTGGVLSERDSPFMSQYSVEEIKAITDAANAGGVMASSHSQGALGIKNAIKAGVDIIEHGSIADDEAIEMMVQHGTMLVPTLSMGRALAASTPGDGIPAEYVAKAKIVIEIKKETFEKSWKAGIPIGCGSDYLSDALSPMGRNAIELEHQVNSGRPVMDVIVSATKINARILGVGKKIGTIEKGKLADLILVDGNPLDEIAILRDRNRIKSVYKNGQKMPRIEE